MVRNLCLLFIIQHFYWTASQSSAGKAIEAFQFYASTMLDWSIQFRFLNVVVCISYCILWFLLDRLFWLILIRKNIERDLFNEIKRWVSDVVCENRIYLIPLQCRSPSPKTVADICHQFRNAVLSSGTPAVLEGVDGRDQCTRNSEYHHCMDKHVAHGYYTYMHKYFTFIIIT